MLNKDKNMSDYYDALNEYQGEDNTIQIDTVISRNQNSKKPFSLDINAEGKLNNVITFINDSTVSVSFDKLIKHNQLVNNTSNSDLNYYLDYSYSDLFIFYLNFPREIEILGLDNSCLEFKNGFGEYSFTLRKSKNNQLQVNSNYKILEDHIRKEELQELDLLNEQVAIAKNKRLLIKIK
jgi:hypothetical protein